MAVGAHHLNLFPSSSQYVSNRDFMNTNQGNANLYNTQMVDQSIVHVPNSNQQSLVNHSVLGKMLVKKSDSGVTFNPQEHQQPRKRPRESFGNEFNFNVTHQQKSDFSSSLFHGHDGINLQMQIQQLEMDRIISQHAEKLKTDIEERKKRQFRQFVTAIESGVTRKLKEKEEEVQKMSKMNYALQEKIKTLFLENQLWREMAQSNEATANTLRNNLEQVLMAHVSEDHGGANAGDAESCCDSNDFAAAEEEGVRWIGEEGVKDKNRKMCRKCEERESCVLVLPCRHLCLCTLCGSTVYTCPICNSNLTATLHVNMSSS